VIVGTSSRIAGIAPTARLVVLVLFALFTAHDAIYVSEYGFGTRYALGMSSTGHDGYYAPASLVVGVAAAILTLVAIVRLTRLTRPTDPAAAGTGTETGPGYLSELRAVWSRLFPTVVLLYAIQENLESIAAGHVAPGADVLFGANSGFVLPILGITTFVLALVGAAIRWRTRVLLRRSVARPSFNRPRASRVPRGWSNLCASLPHLWTLDRRDAGRAPPLPA
jgi:hypothetical protein